MSQTSTQDPLAQYRAKRDIFTPSNLISFMRALMALPAVFTIMGGWYILTATICIVAFISDLLDGLIARKMGDVSEVGKVIDPLADKIYVAVTVSAMAWYGLIPFWYLATILARDLIIVLAGIWATRKFKVVLPSNYPGKAAVLVISLSLFLILVGVRGLTIEIAEGLAVALMLVSLGLYGKRVIDLLKATKVTSAPPAGSVKVSA